MLGKLWHPCHGIPVQVVVGLNLETPNVNSYPLMRSLNNKTRVGGSMSKDHKQIDTSLFFFVRRKCIDLELGYEVVYLS